MRFSGKGRLRDPWELDKTLALLNFDGVAARQADQFIELELVAEGFHQITRLPVQLLPPHKFYEAQRNVTGAGPVNRAPDVWR